MKLILDTHILVWWHEDSPKLPKAYERLLDQKESKGEEIGISVISFWEISKLVSIGKLKVSLSLEQWFAELEEDPLLNIYPLNASILLDSNRLGASFTKDPSDQIIAATARYHELHLMTVDEKIINSNVVAIV